MSDPSTPRAGPVPFPIPWLHHRQVAQRRRAANHIAHQPKPTPGQRPPALPRHDQSVPCARTAPTAIREWIKNPGLPPAEREPQQP